MPLEINSQLGHYEILAPLGAGGMGEVYRARDTRLRREVALKLLPELLAGDPDRMARLEREARMLASLSHPNVAVLHGFEQHGEVRFLVMELVEGETLADRLGRGALDLAEALALFRQIAEGLEAAHERGIVHRDLKPANVKVTPEGRAKILDFGLAKAWAGEESGSASLSLSPTLTAAATQRGEILGTAAYMSPEQARGKAVDRRADVWAFGCVLFEALAARPAFPGDNLTDILAAVVRADPPWEALPGDLPPVLRRLLRRCLEKDPARRLRDMGDARLDLDDAESEAPEEAATAAGGPAALPPRRPILPWTLAALLAAGLGAALLALWSASQPVEAPVRRFKVAVGPEREILGGDSLSVALSPDGRRMAMAVAEEGATYLMLRDLDRLEARGLPGTEGAASPFFSPDGDWIGFIAEGSLKKVALSGGSALALASVNTVSRGATWGADGTIVFSPAATSPLMRISAGGGEPEPLTSLDRSRGERTHRWPYFLPDGKSVVFTVGTLDSPEYYDDAAIEVVSLATGERQRVMEGASMARVTASGHLVYAQGGALFAAPFDMDRLTLTGAPALVQDGVSGSLNSGGVRVAISLDGTLAFVPGVTSMDKNALLWVEMDGTVEELPLPPGPYATPSLSPDGRMVALTSGQGRTNEIWVHDLVRGTLSRLTFEGNNLNPIWTPDGKRITFGSLRDTAGNGVYWKAADGSDEESPLLEGDTQMLPNSWSPDGRFLAVDRQTLDGLSDIWIVPLDGEPYPLLDTRFDEWQATFSPDGRWLAYMSDETGRTEVYVRPFPGPGGRWQVSIDGGSEPRWARDGKQLFYINGDRTMVVPVETEGTFRAAPPQLLFEGRFVRNTWDCTYDISMDGRRVLLFQSQVGGEALDQVTVVLDWLTELRGLAPPAR